MGFLGETNATLLNPLPFGIGQMIMPLPLQQPNTPGLFDLTNNYDSTAPQLVQSTPTPWSLTVPGHAYPLQVTLQGLITGEPGVVQVTNGVLLTIQ